MNKPLALAINNACMGPSRRFSEMNWKAKVLLFLCALGVSTPAWAALETATNLGDITVQLGGWYRVRGELFTFNEDGYRQVDFLDHRLRLELNFLFNEHIKLKSEFSGLENVVWGSNLPTSNVLSQTTTNLAHDTPFLRESTFTTPDTFYLKRLWLEAFIGVGQLRVGRMGSHWGIGLLSNDGNKEESLRGDTYDRIVFSTRPLDSKDINWYTALVYSQVVEGQTGYLGDDIREMVWANFWTDDINKRNKFLGLYLLYRHASASTAFSSDGDAILGDIYFSWDFTPEFSMKGEVLYGAATFKARVAGLLPATSFSGVFYEENPGEPALEVEGSALNFHVEALYNKEKWYARGIVAGQLGASEDHVQLDLDLSGAATDPQRRPIARLRGNQYTLAIDSDVVYDYIMFREAYNVVTKRTPLPFDDGNGSIWNAYLVKLTGGYKTTIKDQVPLDLSASLIWGSVANTDALQVTVFDLLGNQVYSVSPESKDLGIEFDVEAYFTFHERFKLGLIAGYFAPGKFFEDFNEFTTTPNSYYTLTKTPGFTEEGITTFQTRFLLYI